MTEPTGIILLDGANGTGKTTLADAILRRYPTAKKIHCTYRFKNAMWTYHLAAVVHAARLASDKLVLIDRSWPSEEIYSAVYRGGTKIPHQGRIIQKLLRKHGVLTVMCILPEDKAIDQVLKYRQNGYHSPEHVKKPGDVARRYWYLYHGQEVENRVTYVDDVMAAGGLKRQHDVVGYRFDTDGQNIDQAIDNIIHRLNFVRNTQYQPALDFKTRNIAGCLSTAKFLLVGDAVNHPNYLKCWPFMSYGNSTLFMAEAMHLLNCAEEEFMWTNANCPETHVAKLLEAKPDLKVVALGNKASEFLTGLGAKHATVSHPAYGRRFIGLQEWTASFNNAIS